MNVAQHHVDAIREAGGFTPAQVTALINWIADTETGDAFGRGILIADLRELAARAAPDPLKG